MPLAELHLPADPAPPPADVVRLLDAARGRIEAFADRRPETGFVPSDYPAVYHALRALTAGLVPRGRRFCEWGSGFGVVALLAAGLGYEAFGLEAEPELVAEARSLAADFGLPARFVCGSFVPRSAADWVARAGVYDWLVAAPPGYAALGLDPAELDVVFAYPWPDEEAVTAGLFDRVAGPGAVLVTHHYGGRVRARRKPAGRR